MGMVVGGYCVSVAVGYVDRGAVSIICIACYNITFGIDDSGYIALQILYKVIICTVYVNTNYSAVAVKICNEIFGTVYSGSFAYVCAADDDILCVSCAGLRYSQSIAVVAVSYELRAASVGCKLTSVLPCEGNSRREKSLQLLSH